jgi:hypothetical protein
VCYQKEEQHLNIELVGSFDDYSAQKLIDLLKRSANNTSVVFVGTDRITEFLPSGLTSFNDGLTILKDICYRLVFVGKGANKLAPTWTGCF